jgi:HSP90 family molecular chaperone
MKQMGGEKDMDLSSMFPIKQVLVVNADSPLVGKLAAMSEIPGKEEKTFLLALHIYDLARLSHGSLDPTGMATFLDRSTKLLSDLANE